VPDVSLLATVVATVAGFLLGGLWYGPLFGRRWMALVGVTPDQLRRTGSPVVTYGITFVLGLVAAYVFGLYVGPNPGRAFAIVCGAAAGLCWVATALATNYLFEGRPPALIAINAGYHAVRFTLIGVAFALLG
jgi:hypothetical protein